MYKKGKRINLALVSIRAVPREANMVASQVLQLFSRFTLTCLARVVSYQLGLNFVVLNGTASG